MKIKKIKIYNFRQFEKKEISFDKNITVIVGPNARGKSTIIEAIHILSTGQSPWTSDNSAIVRKINGVKTKDGRIEAKIETEDKEKDLAVVLKTNNGSAIKQYRINDKTTTKSKYIQMLSTVIFSPDLIDVLMFEPRQRRLFLDSYISKVDIEYEELTQKYEKALRQRNSLLKIISKKEKYTESDKNSLKFWTSIIVDIGTSITTKRIEFVEKLNQVNPKLYPNIMKYKPNLEITEIETLGDKEYLKKTYLDLLNKRFKKELILGVTLVGPHRDDWILTYNGKNLNKYGSRGEKRMAIADIAFKMNHLLIETYEENPVILLDDISSELDKKNVERLLKEKILPSQQTIITTTNIKEVSKYLNKEFQEVNL